MFPSFSSIHSPSSPKSIFIFEDKTPTDKNFFEKTAELCEVIEKGLNENAVSSETKLNEYAIQLIGHLKEHIDGSYLRENNLSFEFLQKLRKASINAFKAGDAETKEAALNILAFTLKPETISNTLYFEKQNRSLKKDNPSSIFNVISSLNLEASKFQNYGSKLQNTLIHTFVLALDNFLYAYAQGEVNKITEETKINWNKNIKDFESLVSSLNISSKFAAKYASEAIKRIKHGKNIASATLSRVFNILAALGDFYNIEIGKGIESLHNAFKDLNIHIKLPLYEKIILIRTLGQAAKYNYESFELLKKFLIYIRIKKGNKTL